MPRQKRSSESKFVWDAGHANPKQALFYASRTLYTCYGGARGGGKALKNGTPVCTPNGWKPIEALHVGDMVTGSDGKPKTVIGVYPQGVKKLYTLRFRDGFEITASGDHLWKIRTVGKHHKVNGKRSTKDYWEIVTTEEIKNRLEKLTKGRSILFPVCEPVEWEKKDLPIKPYTVGALLGDGGLTGSNVIFSSADEEVIARIRADGYTVNKWRGKYDYGVLGVHGQVVALGMNKDSHSKRAPEIYLNSCIEDRMELLRGLMDTDGFCDTRGHCSYCSVSEGLAKDVQYLVRSLGGMASISVKNRKSGLSYEVNIRMPDKRNQIFHLKRKLERLKPYNGGISDVTRRLVSVTPCGEGECTCIRVDSADHLFVADGFVVTHNTHAVRIKAVGGAFTWPGIKILILRKTYPELQANHIEPILQMVPQELTSYNGTTHTLYFENGSIIRFGHWNGTTSEQEYQGQEYDWIFMDEATQFTEREFRYLGSILRGVNQIPKRFYLTANPGNVGHRWVKRLFIDRNFKQDSENPEENENPDDYCFIPATVDDNPDLLKSSPGYLQALSALPEDIRKAHRYGDWDALGGNYFPEFSRATHVVKPFQIPKHWRRYRSIDYGLDCLAVGWYAVDEKGRVYMYRELKQSGLIVQDAARMILDMTLPDEHVEITFAPPDMWSRQKDTGRTMAEIFMLCGVPIVRADNNRVQGHMMIKEALANMDDGKPGLLFFNTCKETTADLEDIQADEKNPSDCAKEPHEITHTVDSLRYFCVSRTMRAEAEKAAEEIEDEEDAGEDYETFMTGGEADASYMAYGA